MSLEIICDAIPPEAEECTQFTSGSGTRYVGFLLDSHQYLISATPARYIMTMDNKYLTVGTADMILETLNDLREGKPIQQNHMAQVLSSLNP